MRVYYFLMLIIIVSAACTSLENDNNAPQAFPETVEANISSSDPVIITRSAVPTDTPTIMSTKTIRPSETGTPQPTPPITITATTTSTNVSEPIFLAEIQEAHVWWSEDSETLYFQDVETEEAWAYNVSTNISTTIPYEPRSFSALEAQIEATLPENASLESVSPRNQYILYSLPLPELIPFEENLDRLSYSGELWLRKEDQDFKLGLIDSCFGILTPPKWSGNENIATVNVSGAPGIPCQHDVILVDLEALSVGPLLSPWEGNSIYSVADISEDGHLMLIKADIVYFYNRETNEQWPIPDTRTVNIRLVEAAESLAALIFDLEFDLVGQQFTSVEGNVSYFNLSTGATTYFASFEGRVEGIVSPDQKFAVLIIDNEFPSGTFHDNITPAIWFAPLP